MSDNLLTQMLCGKIVDISRVCNLISIQISVGSEEKFFLHIQSFFRILKDEKVVISSEDIYRCGKRSISEDFEWDTPGKSVFDDALEAQKNALLNSKILRCKKENSGDLIITLENNFILQIFVDTTESEKKYRVFNENDDIIVSS